jgi:hypothetical protein
MNLKAFKKKKEQEKNRDKLSRNVASLTTANHKDSLNDQNIFAGRTIAGASC